MAEDKRLRYYNGQFLQEQDFTAEQEYHLDRQRRHNRQLHTYGIAEGLTVTADIGATSATVSPGTAIDGEGRQIVLLQSRNVPFGSFRNQWVLVVISYDQQTADPATIGDEGDTRWWERPDVEVISEAGAPAADARIRLARLQVADNGTVSQHDTSVRTSAGVKLGTELPIERIRLSRPGTASNLWPVLSSGAPSQADVAGNLSVTGNLLVTGTVDGRDVAADGASLDTHKARTDNPHGTTAAQVGALANTAYLRRQIATAAFLNNDANNATRTVNLGWPPKIAVLTGRSYMLFAGNLTYGGALGGGCRWDDAGNIAQTWGHGPVVHRQGNAPYLSFYNEPISTSPIIARMNYWDQTVAPNLHINIFIHIEAVTNGLRLKLVRDSETGTLTFGVDMALVVLG